MPALRAGKEQMYMNNADDITNEEFDTKSLYQIGYGLYVLTTRDGDKDNGCIVNTVMQVTSTPPLIAVVVSKQNYTCGLIKKTGKLNINSLSESTPHISIIRIKRELLLMRLQLTSVVVQQMFLWFRTTFRP